MSKGGEIRDTKNLNFSRNIVSLLVSGQCFPLLSEKDFSEKRTPCLFTLAAHARALWRGHLNLY